MQSTTGTGIRLISLDGGGARALSQLNILESLIYRLQYDIYPDDPDKVLLPCECFDLMGGSDMGGTVAIMFSRLRMSVEEVAEDLHKICSGIYIDDLSPEERTRHLKECIEDLLERRGLPIDLKLGRDSRVIEDGCPCFVVATLKVNMNDKVKLRSYRTRTGPATNATVVEAILATCAMQPTFAPISVGPSLGSRELVGGAMGAGNPCRELILEACDKFKGDTRVSTVISLGSGNPGTLSAPKNDGNEGWMAVLRAMVTNCEEIAQVMEMQIGHLGVYFRFSVDRDLQRQPEMDSPYASWLIMQTEAYLQGVQVSRRIDQYIESLRLRQGLVTIEQLKHTDSRAIYKDVPALTTYFVMREEPWNKMKLLLETDGGVRKQRVLVVSGMAGCGKTQLLIQFTNEFGSKFRHVFFVDASSKESIQVDLISHVRTASPAYSQATFADALSFFSNSRNLPWLITYDNCNDIELDLQSLIPNCSHGSIIITTRNRSRGQFASEPELHLELDVMSDEEAVEVVMKSARLQDSEENGQSASAIAKELGNLPVALAQAGSYIFQTSCTCVEYLQLLRKSKVEMMSIPTADRYQRSAYAAFDLSYQRLPSHVQNFLHLIGCLHFANFPMAAIKVAAEVQFRAEKFVLEDHDERFEECINLLMEIFCHAGSWEDQNPHKMSQTLQSYSLASFTRTTVTSLLRMHPLLHEWSFQRLSSRKKILFRAAASRMVACASDEVPLHQYLIGHINVLIVEPALSSISLNDRGAYGRVLHDLHRLDDSRRILQDIYNKVVEINGSEHPRVATVALELADTFYDNLEEMERLEKEAIRIREVQLGPDHPDTLYAKGQLSGTYQRQERLEEAVKLREEVQEVLNQTFGPTHLEAARSMLYLAQIYFDQGRYSQAEQLEQQVLEVRRENLGETDLQTVQAMYNLAGTYYSLHRYSDAQQLEEYVLKIRKERLGDTHPSTLSVMHALALTYSELDRHSDAQLLQEKLLEKRRLGYDHKETVLCMYNLAWTYHRLEQFTRARELLVEAERVGRDVLGINHPWYRTTVDLLKQIDEDLAKSKPAETLNSTI